MNAKDLMSSPIVTVHGSTRIKEVARILHATGFNAVPVVDERRRLIGIVSEADLVRLEIDTAAELPSTPAIPSTTDPRRTTAADVMTRGVIYGSPEIPISHLARTMVDHGIRTIPIVHDGRVVGILTRGDLIKILIRPDQAIRQELVGLLDIELLSLRFRVEVHDGVVTFTGWGDHAARTLAERIARRVPGVIDVDFATDVRSGHEARQQEVDRAEAFPHREFWG